MTRAAQAAFAAAALAAAAAVAIRGTRHANRPPPPATVELELAPFETWSVYAGAIEARRVHQVRSRLAGPATLTFIAPDGIRVRRDDVVARFDVAQWEREAVRLERDATLARENLAALAEATLPLERTELELRVAEAERRAEDEARALRDARELRAEDLISESEVRQAAARAAAADTERDAARRRLALTLDRLHPAALARARATLAAAEQELAAARSEIANGVAPAPADGILVHVSIAAGSDFRAARVGDTIYRNQTFLVIPETDDLLARFPIPETELPHVREGAEAGIEPTAHPGLLLTGRVDTVSGVAAAPPGAPSGRKSFTVTASIERAPADVRPGMSARVRVLTARSPAALVVPRRAVQWNERGPFCTVWTHGRRIPTAVRTGETDAHRIRITDGLRPGDRVVVE